MPRGNPGKPRVAHSPLLAAPDLRLVAPSRQVIDVETSGKNIKLTLDCGHSKLISHRREVPTKAYCNKCVMSEANYDTVRSRIKAKRDAS